MRGGIERRISLRPVLFVALGLCACQGALNPQPEDPGVTNDKAPVPSGNVGGAQGAGGSGVGGSAFGSPTLRPPNGGAADGATQGTASNRDSGAVADAGSDAADARPPHDARATATGDR